MERGAILDAGCGDGYAASQIARSLGGVPWTGFDPAFQEEEKAALASQYPEARFVSQMEEIEEGASSLLLLLDVLEHCEDDRAVLRSLVERALLPKGWVLITVPAFQSLFSSHDHFLAHYRRYRWESLRPVLLDAGLTPLRWGYLFGSLLPLRALGVLVERWRGGAAKEAHGIGGWKRGRWVTEIVAKTLQTENKLFLQMERYGIRPPGLSVWALAKRQ